MTRSLRQNMAWIHGWLGLLAGWMLFAMFLTGTASYFRPEITRWMQPELSARPVPTTQAATTAVAHMQKVGADDIQWFVSLPDDRSSVVRIFEQTKPAPDEKPTDRRRKRPDEIQLDPASGNPAHARETRGGEHFYRFHFQLQLPHPWGRWLAGVCAMFMLGAIISGVITHKRFFADFFTLRWNKGQRSWLDAHNASAVLALPFHAMITYTGLITLVAMYMPWPTAANFAKPDDLYQIVRGLPPETEATGIAAPLAPVGPMLADAERRWGAPASHFVVRNPNDSAATVTVTRGKGASINARNPSIVYSGTTGRQIAESSESGPAAKTAGVLLGLHLAHFAGPALRWVLFLLGGTGAAMVGTGLLLWTAARRRPNATPFFGMKLVERLNIAVVAGLPTGMAAFLLANRLIPADLPGRQDMEVQAMFWTWGILSLAQFLRPARRAWAEGFALSAIAFAAIPLVNAATTQRGLVSSLASGDMLFVGFDCAMLMVAALLGFAGWKAGKPPKVPARRRRTELAHA